MRGQTIFICQLGVQAFLPLAKKVNSSSTLFDWTSRSLETWARFSCVMQTSSYDHKWLELCRFIMLVASNTDILTVFIFTPRDLASRYANILFGSTCQNNAVSSTFEIYRGWSLGVVSLNFFSVQLFKASLYTTRLTWRKFCGILWSAAKSFASCSATGPETERWQFKDWKSRNKFYAAASTPCGAVCTPDMAVI